MPSILFVCIHNACRSQIAQAICKKSAPDSWIIASAGIRPSSQVDPKAAQILGKHGLAMTQAKPIGFAQLSDHSWDYLVDISCLSKHLPVVAQKTLRWELADPMDGPLDLYQELYDELQNRISKLIEEIGGIHP
ncbi:MAG: low molecular weight phosphatase family protein [Elusimicrobia bacterium]|nr:low molecular weight phosphatase family protein [Elusimicrobiota bacterium]